MKGFNNLFWFTELVSKLFLIFVVGAMIFLVALLGDCAAGTTTEYSGVVVDRVSTKSLTTEHRVIVVEGEKADGYIRTIPVSIAVWASAEKGRRVRYKVRSGRMCEHYVTFSSFEETQP